MTDNAHPSDAHLHELIEQEEAAWQQTVAAERAEPPDMRRLSKLARDWWAACARLIQEHLKLCRAGASPPLPAAAMERWANIADDFSRGRRHAMVRYATRGPGRPAGRDERHDKAQAVFYIEAVKAAQIEDGAPIKTVSTLYGVHGRTIRKWLKKGADNIIKGIPRPSISSVHASMSAAAKNYTQGNNRGRVDPAETWEDEDTLQRRQKNTPRRLRRVQERIKKAHAAKEEEHTKDIEADVAAAWESLELEEEDKEPGAAHLTD
jgi:hypothetical protein